MDRIECEQELIEKAIELAAIYRKYRPNGFYLSIGIIDDHIDIHNQYFKSDKDFPICIRRKAIKKEAK